MNNGFGLSGVTTGQSNDLLGDNLESESPPGVDEHPELKSQTSGDESVHQENAPNKEVEAHAEMRETCSSTPRLTRQERLSKMRRERSLNIQRRKKKQFQPVEQDIAVETRRAATRRGQRLLDADQVSSAGKSP